MEQLNADKAKTSSQASTTAQSPASWPSFGGAKKLFKGAGSTIKKSFPFKVPVPGTPGAQRKALEAGLQAQIQHQLNAQTVIEKPPDMEQNLIGEAQPLSENNAPELSEQLIMEERKQPELPQAAEEVPLQEPTEQIPEQQPAELNPNPDEIPRSESLGNPYVSDTSLEQPVNTSGSESLLNTSQVVLEDETFIPNVPPVKPLVDSLEEVETYEELSSVLMALGQFLVQDKASLSKWI